MGPGVASSHLPLSWRRSTLAWSGNRPGAVPRRTSFPTCFEHDLPLETISPRVVALIGAAVCHDVQCLGRDGSGRTGAASNGSSRQLRNFSPAGGFRRAFGSSVATRSSRRCAGLWAGGFVYARATGRASQSRCAAMAESHLDRRRTGQGDSPRTLLRRERAARTADRHDSKRTRSREGDVGIELWPPVAGSKLAG